MPKLEEMPTQNAIIKMPDKKTKFVKMPTVEPGFARDKRVARFKEDCYKLANFVKTEQEAKEHLEKRMLELKQITGNSFSLSKLSLQIFETAQNPVLRGNSLN